MNDIFETCSITTVSLNIIPQVIYINITFIFEYYELMIGQWQD